MAEKIDTPKNEIDNLRARVKKLAGDNSYSQMIIGLMGKISSAPGLENTIENLLRNSLDIIGGLNHIIYYWIESDLYYADAYGVRKLIDKIDDPLVAQVVETRNQIEHEYPFSATLMTTPEFSKAYTWLFPLMIGQDIIGIYKMENLHIGMQPINRQLSVFFNYVAMILKNEISGYTKLKKAYDQLEQEIEVRKQTEEELLVLNEELEKRVAERTLELENANERLQVELSERRRAEQALSIQEQGYRTLVENIPDLIVRYDPNLHRVYVNPAWEDASGLSSGEVVNVHAADIPRVPKPINNEYKEKLLEVLKSGTPQAFEFSWVNAHGVMLYLDYVLIPEYDHYGKVVSVLACGHDITKRKQAEEQILRLNRIYAVQSNINQAIVRIHETQELLNEACRIAIEYGKFRMAWIGMVNLQTNKVDVVASSGVSGDYLKNINIDLNNDIRSNGPAGTAVKTGKHKISNNIKHDDSMIPWRNNAMKYDYKSIAAFPLIVFDKVIGTFTIYSNETDFFDEEDIKLLDEMTNDISFALEFIESKAKRKKNEELLKQSESRLNEAQHFAHIGNWELDLVKNVLIWSDEIYCIFEIDPNHFGASYEAFLNAIHPEDRDAVNAAYTASVKNRSVYSIDHRLLFNDGRIKYVHEQCETFYDKDGAPLRSIGIVQDITERRRAEEERLARQRFFENMDKINRAIQGASDLDSMMSDVLDTVLSIFNCDRTWLVYPCDPEAATWRAMMERNRPGYPGAFDLKLEIAMEPDVAETLRILLASNGPVKFGLEASHPLPADVSERFGFKSFMSMAIYPRTGSPWQFGIYQCTCARVWTANEERLFQEIGRRLGDGLSTLLAYRNLKDSRGKLEEAQRIAHVGYWDRVITANRITLSDEACRIFGISSQEQVFNLEQWHERWLTLIHPEDRLRLGRAVVEALSVDGPRYDVEYRIVRSDNEIRSIHSEANVFRDHTGRPTRMLGMMQDITERKRTEEALRESELKYRQIFENSIEGIFQLTLDDKLIGANPALAKILGYANPEEMMDLINNSGGIVSENIEKRFVSPEKFSDFKDILKKNVTIQNLETKIINANGEKIWISINAHLVKDETGRNLYIEGMIEDITFRKQSEEKIKASLLEKEALLRELYHRTKNNMQMICAMLMMHSLKTDSREFKNIFKDIETRIHSMALVHQKLYKSKDLSNINLNEYASELTNLLMKSYNISPDRISIDLNIENISVLIDIAIPCGLILNELVSNSLKYAFPSERRGKILLSIVKREQTIDISYSDNGVGLPSGFDYRNDGQMGLQSVISTVEDQLLGNISIVSEKGFNCNISFQNTLYKKRI